MSKNKLGLFSILVILFSLILYFQNWLINVSKPFGYADEFIAIILFLYFILSLKKIKKNTFYIISLMIFIIIGALSFNYKYKIQNHSIAIIEDIIGNFKFIFIFIGLQEFMKNNSIKTNFILKKILFFIKIYTFLLFMLCIANIFININMSNEYRYGLRSFSFIYGTAGHLINQMTYNLVLLSADKELNKSNNKFWTILSLIVMISTLKTRAFILCLVYIMLSYFFILRKRKKIGLEIGMIIVLVALTGYSQFEHYFLNEGTPRQMFVSGAISITKEYFPFGTGFATYGSSAAAEYYSKLYYKLGFSDRWGMSPTASYYLNDNYLPMILGQFGILLSIVFFILLYMVIKKIITDEKVSNSKNIKVITYFLIADIIFSSVQSSYLAHYSVVTILSFFTLFFYKNKIMEEN